jgi:hypothetical protein
MIYSNSACRELQAPGIGNGIIQSAYFHSDQVVRRLSLLFLICFGTMLLHFGLRSAAAAQAATVYHVKPSATGSGDGSNWDNATSLQGALGSASAGDEIWVSTGTYLPGTAVTESFQLVPGVAVYGGFAATETLRTERDWVANLTILSGDIDDNDIKDPDDVVTATAGIMGSNSDHIVTADGASGTPITETTVLDGFIITAGQADGIYPHDNGGGIYCDGGGAGSECSPQLVNLTFAGNFSAEL